MKYYQLLLAALLPFAFVSAAFGQAGSFETGLEGGPSLAVLRGDWTANPALRYAGGISFQYNKSDILAFRTAIAFEQKSDGGRLESSDGSDAGTAFLHFNYLTIPLLARLTFGGRIRYFVNAGPYTGYLIKAVSRYSPAASLGLENTEDDLTKFYKRFDAGLTAGLGVALPLHERVLLSLEVRNNLGLLNISNSSLVIRQNSTSFLLEVAYRLGNGTNSIK